MEKGGIKLTILLHSTQSKSNHNNQKDGYCSCHLPHSNYYCCHPSEGPVTPQGFPPHHQNRHYYTLQNPSNRGEPIVTLMTQKAPSVMNITLISGRTRPSPMDKQSLSLNPVKARLQTQRANQFSSSQVDGMGEGGVIKSRGS